MRARHDGLSQVGPPRVPRSVCQCLTLVRPRTLAANLTGAGAVVNYDALAANTDRRNVPIRSIALDAAGNSRFTKPCGCPAKQISSTFSRRGAARVPVNDMNVVGGF